jgi:hypothetical protein
MSNYSNFAVVTMSGSRSKELLWEFSALKFKKSVWNKMKTAIFNNPQRDQIRIELQSLRTEHTKNESKLETMYDDKTEGVITEKFWKTQNEKIEDRQSQIEERLEELEALKKFYDVKVKKSVLALDALENFGEKFKKADPRTRKEMVNLMVRKIFVIGGGKDSQGHKIPYDLYIEWNEDFAGLYELGLVELSKETEKKYNFGLVFLAQKIGLPRCARNDTVVFNILNKKGS